MLQIQNYFRIVFLTFIILCLPSFFLNGRFFLKLFRTFLRIICFNSLLVSENDCVFVSQPSFFKNSRPSVT